MYMNFPQLYCKQEKSRTPSRHWQPYIFSGSVYIIIEVVHYGTLLDYPYQVDNVETCTFSEVLQSPYVYLMNIRPNGSEIPG